VSTSAGSSAALNAFRATARKMRPTLRHRPALWENMLGTVYACNAAGVTEYFDYDYAAALRHVGAHEDVRVWRATHREAGHGRPRPRQLVWYVRFK
jgi:hypothetical protein